VHSATIQSKDMPAPRVQLPAKSENVRCEGFREERGPAKLKDAQLRPNPETVLIAALSRHPFAGKINLSAERQLSRSALLSQLMAWAKATKPFCGRLLLIVAGVWRTTAG
jgi:hypothetical protein